MQPHIDEYCLLHYFNVRYFKSKSWLAGYALELICSTILKLTLFVAVVIDLYQTVNISSQDTTQYLMGNCYISVVYYLTFITWGFFFAYHTWNEGIKLVISYIMKCNNVQH